MPVSMTEIDTVSFALIWALMVMLPFCVNFSALLKRLTRICFTF